MSDSWPALAVMIEHAAGVGRRDVDGVEVAGALVEVVRCRERSGLIERAVDGEGVAAGMPPYDGQAADAACRCS